MQCESMPPVGAASPSLLILGSMPGAQSLAQQRYYAHPRNLFWRLLGGAAGEDLQNLAYEMRLQRLAARGITLWDACRTAERPGSLDSAIRGAVANDLAGFAKGSPGLRAVAFNGAKAADLGRRAIGDTELALIDLPSSSPANARIPPAEKQSRWDLLAPFMTGNAED